MGVWKSGKLKSAHPGASTAMDTQKQDPRLLLEHRKPGQGDAYSLRNPEQTADAAKAIYDYYKVAEHIQGAK